MNAFLDNSMARGGRVIPGDRQLNVWFFPNNCGNNLQTSEGWSAWLVRAGLEPRTSNRVCATGCSFSDCAATRHEALKSKKLKGFCRLIPAANKGLLDGPFRASRKLDDRRVEMPVVSRNVQSFPLSSFRCISRSK